jgi:transcriptional regulator with XRE-family HTH domain
MDDRRKFTLKGLRVNNNWTIPEAAVKYGVSVDTVKNYEAYRTFPDVPIIENILKATGLRYDDIIFLPINVEPHKRN